MINDLLGKNVKPLCTDPRPGDIMHSLADITLAKNLLACTPKTSFQQGLKKAIHCHQKRLI
ncbi:MAG: hypothetical protein ACYTBJ_18845 [Planctomycetota bacterium]